ncbi:MAG: hydantoinase/oxoprolinase family protein, partial [Pseudomonadota bacterium]|nr:hydantoinase/oxoprolinase family protein [Pseudomonadota bacterium]
MVLLAVDIGGTFTDLMAFDEVSGRFYQAKSLTTPNDLTQGIVDCIDKSELDPLNVAELIHGTTQAINTLIERKGAKTALLVTRGTRDVYIIGRGNRPESYNLHFHRARPLVSRRATHEVAERMKASGEVFEALDENQISEICARLKADDVEAVAVCFLHSYANSAHEREVGNILRENLPGKYVSLSHEVLREYREYERMSTTVVNAYIGPKVAGYIDSLQSRLNDIGFRGALSIMQSNGGVMTPEIAVEKPVAMMESGPVGGINASARVGMALGFNDVISFDMGGTTAKASLIRDGRPGMADGYYVGGYASGDPVMAPVVDVVEIGAGGGSIAWIDEVGALKVGPQSAGAAPGPVCYGAGGVEPTITDANVILGRVGAADFLGGEMALDLDAATAAIERKVAATLGMNALETSRSIIEIAIAKMSLAVREISVEKGYDPRDFSLVAAGGAGPLHAVAIARDLHIPTVIIPRFPAHFSALGMLMADERHDFTRTHLSPLDRLDFAWLRDILGEMVRESQRVMKETRDVTRQIYMDLRYVGQEFTLSVPVTVAQLDSGDIAAIRRDFDDLHEQRYAHHAADEPLELVNLRMVALGRRPRLQLPNVGIEAAMATEPVRRPVYFDDPATPVDCPVHMRDDLAAGATIDGPALIQE